MFITQYEVENNFNFFIKTKIKIIKKKKKKKKKHIIYFNNNIKNYIKLLFLGNINFKFIRNIPINPIRIII